MTTTASSLKLAGFPLLAPAAQRRNRLARAQEVTSGRVPVLMDTVAALVALAGVLVARDLSVASGGVAALLAARVTLTHVILLALLVTAWPFVFCTCGLYRVAPDRGRMEEALRAAGSMAIAAAIAIGLLEGFRPGVVPAGIRVAELVNLWWAGTLLLLLTHGGWRTAMRWRRARRVVIVGSGLRAASIHDALVRDVHVGYEVVGFVDDADATPAAAHIEQRMLGTLETLETMLMRHAIDEVFVALPVKSRYREIHEILGVCERIGVSAKYRADLFETELAWPSYKAADAQVVTMQVAPCDYRLAIKRVIDTLGACVLLVLFSPLMLAVAVGVKLTSPGPILFAQERYGLNRRPFRMLKFRTMVSGAERLQDQLEDRNELDGPVFKISDDPRITRFGGLLRRTSLDELPQLFNVLRGEMSLVGPRPLPLRDVHRFTRAADMRRCSVRPGLTCLWQVSGRNTLSFDEWMRLDLCYVDSWSLLLDFVILARTVPAVLRRTGAH